MVAWLVLSALPRPSAGSMEAAPDLFLLTEKRSSQGKGAEFPPLCVPEEVRGQLNPHPRSCVAPQQGTRRPRVRMFPQVN